MVTFDIVIIVMTLFFFFLGMKRGLIMEVAGLVGVILAILLATKFSYIAYDLLIQYVDAPRFGPIIAFVLTLVIAIIVIHRISVALSEAVSDTFILSSVNRIGGAVLSSVEALFLAGCFIFLCEEYVSPDLLMSDSQKEQSYTYKPVKSLASYVIERIDIPASKKAITDFIDQNTKN